MSVAGLITRPCVLLLRTTDGKNAHGKAIKDETRVETVCHIQQDRTTEPPAAGEVADTFYNCWFLPDDENAADLTTGDAVEVDGLVHEMVGVADPVVPPWSDQPDHIQTRLRRVAGAGSRQAGS